jgi:hypothetical protein
MALSSAASVRLRALAGTPETSERARVPRNPLRHQRARDLALPLQQDVVNSRAVHRQSQRLAYSCILDTREHQRDHTHRRTRPDPLSRGHAPQLVRRQLHDFGAAQLDGALPQRTRHLNIHRIEEGPPARGIVLGGVHGTMSRLPARDRETAAQLRQRGTGLGRIGRLDRLAHFDPQSAAVVRAGGGVAGKGEEACATKNSQS